MLPSPLLKPAYDKIVWFWLYRDFSGSPADRAAEAVALRLGLTMYPQHYLIDPGSLDRLANTGRSVESFLAAVAKVKVTPSRTLDAANRLAEADSRAAELEESGSIGMAKKLIDDPDVLVRYRALRILAEKAPKEVAARAEALLSVPNDPIRFETCSILKKAATLSAARALEAIVAEPENTLNPNVLRSRAVGALSTCGDARSVQAIRPFAASGNYRNGLTGVSIDTLAAIAARIPDAAPAVRDALIAGYPEPAEDPKLTRACVGLAKRVHSALEKVTRRKVKFPGTYDSAARARLVKAFSTNLK